MQRADARTTTGRTTRLRRIDGRIRLRRGLVRVGLRSEDRVDSFDGGDVDALLVCAADGATVERVEFHAFAVREVVVEAGIAVLVVHRLHRVEPLRHRVPAEADALGVRDRDDLLDDAPVERPRLLGVVDDAERLAGGGGEAGLRADERELVPKRRVDAVGVVGAHPRRGLAGVVEVVRERRPLRWLVFDIVVLPEDNARWSAGVLDDAGLLDRAEDVGDAAPDALGTDDVGEDVLVVDAVLEGEHRGVRTEHRVERRGSVRGVEGLHTEEDEVDFADGRGIVGRRAVDHEIAGHALDRDAVLAEGLEVLAARDEGDVVTLLGETAAVVRADAARTVDCDIHARCIDTGRQRGRGSRVRGALA